MCPWGRESSGTQRTNIGLERSQDKVEVILVYESVNDHEHVRINGGGEQAWLGETAGLEAYELAKAESGALEGEQ